jgi:ketosteroid isomerase-like protein
MKRLFILTALMVICGTLCYGQKKMTVEQSITKMEQELTDAVIKKDMAAFDKYYADGAVFTDPGGGLMNKAETIAFIKSPDFMMASSVIDGMKVQTFGDTAVATYATTDKGTIKGRDISGRYRWNDVWVKMGGKWKVILTQGTPITP